MRSKIESFLGAVSATKRLQENRQEIRSGENGKVLQPAEMLGGFRGAAGKRESSRNTDCGRRGEGLRVNHHRGGPSLKSGVEQVYVWQHDDQQHDQNHAAEHDQT
jgi:hypothetical protein